MNAHTMKLSCSRCGALFTVDVMGTTKFVAAVASGTLPVECNKCVDDE